MLSAVEVLLVIAGTMEDERFGAAELRALASFIDDRIPGDAPIPEPFVKAFETRSTWGLRRWLRVFRGK